MAIAAPPAHARLRVASVEGEAFGPAVADASASAGRSLRLTRPGRVGVRLRAPGAERLEVRARGAGCPMTLRLDGRTLLRTIVSGSTWRAYGAPVALDEAAHVVSLALGRTRRCHGGLRVDRVTLTRRSPIESRPPGRAAAVPAPGAVAALPAAAVGQPGAPAAIATPIVRRAVALGTALLWSRVGTDDSYRRTFLAEYGWLTPENEMKMDALQPQRGRFSFATADAIVAFAEQNGKSVHGHTLVWGGQLPGWLTSGAWTRDELLGILSDHVRTVVGHFRGRVPEWDVVNEPLADDGSMRPNVWFDTIGADYVERALRVAHEADPAAKLYVNEVGTEAPGPKASAFLRLVRGLRERGVPLDGVGMQIHTNTASYPHEADIAAEMQRYAGLGLGVEVTEMDVGTSATGGTVADRLAQQARAYGEAARACNAVTACTRFTTWGFTDAQSWLGSAEMGLPFDADERPKPAYDAIHAAFAPH